MRCCFEVHGGYPTPTACVAVYRRPFPVLRAGRPVKKHFRHSAWQFWHTSYSTTSSVKLHVIELSFV